ncbi:MAG: hypothetical protein HYU97_07580 [Deltaproteobacteria bacterium]|nr:hypothetical protein [Deltaproteobacteria bacterium]
MVDGVGDAKQKAILSCEPNTQGLAAEAAGQAEMQNLERVVTDPQFIPAQDIYDFLQSGTLPLNHPLSLRSRQWGAVNRLVDKIKNRIPQELAENPAARSEYERELITQILAEFYFPRSLGLVYDAQMETALDATQALEQQAVQCRELSYIFVIMARQAGLNAFFMGVDRYQDGRTPYEMGMGHMLAGVLLSDGTVLQADPTEEFVSSEVMPGHCEVHFESDQEVASDYVASKAFFEDLKSRSENANEFYYRAAILNPENGMARLGNLYHAKFDSATEAIGYYQNLANYLPHNPEIQLVTGQVYAQSQDGDQALFYFQRAIELSKDVVYAEAYLSSIEVLEAAMQKYKPMPLNLSFEEKQNRWVQLHLTLLNCEPYNAYDAYLLEKASQLFLETLQKNRVELGDSDYEQEDLLKQAEDFVARHRIAFDQLPSVVKELTELGYYTEALKLTERFLGLNGWLQLWQADDRTTLNMELLHGEIPYLKGLKALAKENWQNSPHWAEITHLFSRVMADEGYPGSGHFTLAVRFAKRLLLLVPNDIEARQFLALAFAINPELQEEGDTFDLSDSSTHQPFLQALAVLEADSSEIRRAKLLEFSDGLRAFLEEESPDGLQRIFYFLEYYFLERQDLESLKILLKLREDLNIQFDLNRFLTATHYEKMGDLLMTDADLKVKTWARRCYTTAAMAQESLWADDPKGFVAKVGELVRVKNASPKDSQWIDQDFITHYLNAHFTVGFKSVTSPSLEQSYRRDLSLLSGLNMKNSEHYHRALQVFANRLVTIAIYPPEAYAGLDPLDVLGKKAVELLEVLETRKRFFAKHGLAENIRVEERQFLFLELVSEVVKQGYSLREIQTAVPLEFWVALSPVAAEAGFETEDSLLVIQAALAYLDLFAEDGQSTAIAILEKLAKKYSGKMDQTVFSFDVDTLGDHPFGPLVPYFKAFESKQRQAQSAYQIAESLAREANRSDLAQSFSLLENRLEMP